MHLPSELVRPFDRDSLSGLVGRRIFFLAISSGSVGGAESVSLSELFVRSGNIALNARRRNWSCAVHLFPYLVHIDSAPFARCQFVLPAFVFFFCTHRTSACSP